MAVVLGTSAGFVEVAPVDDPLGTGGIGIDNVASVTRDTSPSTAAKITEVGFWADNATEESNFEVGLYAADGSVVPGEAGTLLFVSRTNAKGTGAGWKSATVDWDIDPDTSYWLAFQLDDTATQTIGNVTLSGGAGYDQRGSQSTLADPFGGGALADADGVFAIYAVWEEGASGGVDPGNIRQTQAMIL